MRLQDRLQKLTNIKKDINDWIYTSFMLCQTFKWDYHTLMKQPIPFIFDMIAAIEFENEKNKDSDDKKDNKNKSLGFSKKR